MQISLKEIEVRPATSEVGPVEAAQTSKTRLDTLQQKSEILEIRTQKRLAPASRAGRLHLTSYQYFQTRSSMKIHKNLKPNFDFSYSDDSDQN